MKIETRIYSVTVCAVLVPDEILKLSSFEDDLAILKGLSINEERLRDGLTVNFDTLSEYVNDKPNCSKEFLGFLNLVLENNCDEFLFHA